MSKWKETNKYGIHESKAAYRHYTRRRDKEAEILKELEPNPPTHVDLTGLETYIQRLRESKEPTMDDNYLIWFDVETSGLDPMSDNLLEVEARITDMKGLQVPFADDHLIFHRVSVSMTIRQSARSTARPSTCIPETDSSANA